MSKNRIVHCMYAEKFIDPFITFVEKHFDADQHLYLIKRFLKYEVTPRNNTKFISATITFAAEVLFYIYHLNYSKKIIIHGLFNPRLVIALFLQPWLLRRTYWIIWGGDLYYHDLRSHNFASNIHEIFRTKVIKNIGHIVTYATGDYALAKKWYETKALLHESFVYQSNLFSNVISPSKKDSKLTKILVGNSANKSNSHDEVLYKLKSFETQDIQIFCPLSYGDEIEKLRVSELGQKLFGNKFIPLTTFMPYGDYLKLLSEIDIAIFNHKRQQAFGNTITLLGMGKKVFLNHESNLNDLFKKFGVQIYDVQQLNLNRLPTNVANNNIKNIIQNFSENSLINSLYWLK